MSQAAKAYRHSYDTITRSVRAGTVVRCGTYWFEKSEVCINMKYDCCVHTYRMVVLTVVLGTVLYECLRAEGTHPILLVNDRKSVTKRLGRNSLYK